MHFNEWFDNTWELMTICGSGKMVTNFEEFKENLKEAFEAGYKKGFKEGFKEGFNDDGWNC